MNLKEIIQRLEAKYGITGTEGFTEELVEQIEAMVEEKIEAEISARKEEWKKELLEKLPKEKGLPEIPELDSYRTGYDDCLSEIKTYRGDVKWIKQTEL